MFETILEKTEISSIEEMFGVIRLKWFYQPMAFGWFLYPMSDLGPLLDFYIAGIKKEDNYYHWGVYPNFGSYTPPDQSGKSKTLKEAIKEVELAMIKNRTLSQGEKPTVGCWLTTLNFSESQKEKGEKK